MSDKNVLDEFLNRKPKPAGGSPSATVLPLQQRQSESETKETTESVGTVEPGESELVERRAFGVGRGRRQPFMLDVRKLDKQQIALSYSHLTKIAFDPSGVIALEFSSQLVRIEGSSLKTVYEHLVLQNVIYLQEENPELEQHITSGEPFISKIEIGEL